MRKDLKSKSLNQQDSKSKLQIKKNFNQLNHNSDPSHHLPGANSVVVPRGTWSCWCFEAPKVLNAIVYALYN